jgi:uncharacterized protein (TIGR03437 family)
VKCLRNGLGKRQAGCAPLPRPAKTGGFGAARGSRGEKPGFNCPPKGGRVYTPTDWEPKMEILGNPTRRYMMKLRVFRVTLLVTLVSGVITGLSAAPVITSVMNAASNKDPRLPGASIAKGSIFIVYGSGLGPANIIIAPAAFQSTSLSGTSVKVTVNGQPVDALMYYTSSTQIAALLPSSTPAGGPETTSPNVQATITVTYNGESSASTPFRGVTNSSVGIFTVDSSGSGPAIVTYPDYSLVSPLKAANCGGPNTTCGAANPGDTLILWATGLGPVSGAEASGAGLGQNFPNLPLTVWLGGVQASVAYQGRSGCCVGEDQIVFTVPNDVPTGCAVPLVVQVGIFVSNSTVMPVARGSRSCTPTDPIVAEVNLQQVSALGSFTLGSVELGHLLNQAGTDPTDQAKFTFLNVSGVPAGLRPFLASYLDQPPAGACTVMGPRSPAALLFDNFNLAPLDGGSSFTIAGPIGPRTVTANPGQGAFLARAGFLRPGNYTITGGPGKDVGAFTARVTIPAPPTLTSPASSNGLIVTRREGMTLTWNPGGVTGPVTIALTTFAGAGYPAPATVICTAPGEAGTFTIPPYALLALSSGGGAYLSFQPAELRPVASATFSASGLNIGIVQAFMWDSGLSNFSLR